MIKMKPIWLLDVDGVMNAVQMPGKVPTGPGMWTEWEMTSANGFGITWSPQLVKRMNDLVVADKVEIVWLTTWWDNIEDLPFPDWHGFRVANTREEYLSHVSWWKLPVVQRLYSPDQKMVWTDDDIDYDREAVDWLTGKHNILPICPKTLIGITPNHMDKIEEFLDG